MKKKLLVVTVAEGDEVSRLAQLPAEATVALQDLAASIKDGLMAFCCSAGLGVLAQLMEQEMTVKVGPKGRHDPERIATRNGSAPGSVVLGGRSVPVRRPRATRTSGAEVQLCSYALFSDRDLLTQVAVERMLAGVATRRHALVAEPIGEDLEIVACGDSTSVVSRRFVAATEKKLAELLSSDLSGHDAAVLMIDGIVFHECCCVVALLITADGTTIPAGVWEGDTEDTTVVKHLLADLVDRGLRFEQGLLCVIDEGKALAAGIKRVFGQARRRAALCCAQAQGRGRRPGARARLAHRPPAHGRVQRSRRSAGPQGGQGSRCPARARAPERAQVAVRGTQGHVQRPPARCFGPPRPVAVVHERHRVDDLNAAPRLLGVKALA